MQASAIPYKFATPWAADATTGYVTGTIPATTTGGAASQQLGFPPITAQPTGSGGVPPNIADINGLGFYATLWAQWLQAGGPIGYDATFASAIGGYPKGAIIDAAEVGQSWLCTADNNTADPDTGGVGWQLVGRVASQAASTSANTTWTVAANGSFINIAVSGTTQTLPAPSAVEGMTIGFYAAVACTLATPSGEIIGGSLSGSTLALASGQFWFGQSDGGNWRTISASPELVLSVRSIAQGGTGATTAATARTNLGAAALAGSASQTFSVANGTTSAEAVAFGQFSLSLGGSGFQRLPGGLIIQWGAASAPANGDGSRSAALWLTRE